MANFATHINVASIASGLLSTYFYSIGSINIETAFLAFSFGIIGGILPDLDHQQAIPIKILEFITSNLIAFITTIKLLEEFNKIYYIPIFWLTGFLISYFLFMFFKKTTVHRGMFHSIPAALIALFFSFLLLRYFLGVSIIKSYFVSLFVFIGYIVHLILDELYSVDLTNKKLKKSFGTAIKFYNRNLQSTLFTYSLLVTLIIITPHKEILIKLVRRILNV